MTSSMMPSARRPSAGASFDRPSNLGWPAARAGGASRATTGCAPPPPTHPPRPPPPVPRPEALGADRMMRRRGHRLARLPGRCLDRRREEIVHEGPSEIVAVLVVGDLLVQGRREAHRQTAVDLAVDDHRVDDVAAIVDRDE